MGFTAGIDGDNGATGWSSFTASLPTGEGDGFSGAGTRKIYVSKAGNNANDGSSASPVLTVAVGMSKMRNGSPDWLLLREGDTWTDETIENVTVSGLSATELAVFGSYDPANPTVVSPGTGGARPVLKPQPGTHSSGIGSTAGGGLGTRGNFIAAVGIDFYNYTHDPVNVGTTFNALDGNRSGTSFANPYSFLLIEDCLFRFFSDGVNFDIAIADGVHNNTCFRRNIVVDSWSSSSRSQGMHAFQNYQNFKIQENLFDQNGYSSVLSAPATATLTIASPCVVTWTTPNPLYNGASITFHDNGDTLPTGLAFATEYWIVSYGVDGAGKFRLSATSGGAAINTSGTQSGTHKLAWDGGDSPQFGALGLQNHNIYLDSINDVPIVSGNIISRSLGGNGMQGRCGAVYHDNLDIQNRSGTFIAGVTGSTAYSNVFTEGLAGYSAFSIVAARGATAHDNIVANGGVTASSAISIDNSADADFGRVHFTLANPCVVSFDLAGNPVGRTFENQIFQFLGNGTSVLPAHVVTATNYYAVNAGTPGLGKTNISLTNGGALVDTSADSQTEPFRSFFLARDNSATNNIVYNWGNTASNIVDTATGNTISPNQNFAAGSGSFPDPSRTVARYNNEVLGGTASLDAFLTAARGQRKGSWDSRLTARAVNTWISAGFTTASVTAVPMWSLRVHA